MQKSADAFRTISEVADDLSLPQHVLRFWETRFPQIRPLKRAGGRRYYRPADISLLRAIRQLLYEDGYTIKGVQRLLKEQGARELGARPAGPDVPLDPPSDADDEDFGQDELRSPELGSENLGDEGTGDPSAAAPHQRIETAPVPNAARPAPSRRDLILDTLTIVEDCKRILDALLLSER